MKKTLSAAPLLFVFVFGFVEEFPLAAGGVGPLMDDRFCADTNGDGQINISDPVRILNALFAGGEDAWCVVEGLNIGAQLAELENANALLTQSNTDLTQSNADLSARITELETSNASLTDSLNAASNANAVLTQSNADLTQSNADLAARITELETSNTSLTDSLDAASNANAVLTQNNADLAARITELETSNASLTVSLDVASNEIADLTASLDAASNEIVDLTASLDAANTTNVALAQSNDELTALLADLVIEGCTDPEATNYDPLANVDDGSCLIPAGFTFTAVNTQGYNEYTHTSGLTFVLLPGGEFQMGSPESEPGRPYGKHADEQLHTVTLSPFLIGKYEVTQSEYEAVMADHAFLSATPSSNLGTAHADPLRPVETVSWDNLKDADGFLARTGLSLPSEAQWEYACRAGTSGRFSGHLDDMAWYEENSGRNHHYEEYSSRSHQPVGTKQANHFGLHDMHGNVYEWCEDVYDGDFYNTPSAAGPDPVNDTGSGQRVFRGGGFRSSAHRCRSAFRNFNLPPVHDAQVGFRPAIPVR